DKNQLAVKQTKFKFGVGNDDAAFTGVIARKVVDLQTRRANAFARPASGNFARLLERNVFVVGGFGFGRGGEDRLRQFGRFFQVASEFDAAGGLRFLIFFPAR